MKTFITFIKYFSFCFIWIGFGSLFFTVTHDKIVVRLFLIGLIISIIIPLAIIKYRREENHNAEQINNETIPFFWFEFNQPKNPIKPIDKVINHITKSLKEYRDIKHNREFFESIIYSPEFLILNNFEKVTIDCYEKYIGSFISNGDEFYYSLSIGVFSKTASVRITHNGNIIINIIHIPEKSMSNLYEFKKYMETQYPQCIFNTIIDLSKFIKK